MSDTPLFLKACRGEPVERPPLWLMRQAGRYMPEYRAVRAQAGSFLELCRTPELCVEVTLQPIRRFGFDASILFSDILIPAEAMGAEVVFEEGEGPRILNPFRHERDLERFHVPDPEEAAPFVFEAVRGLRQALPASVPLIGFVAAPWTLCCYLIEGGGSRNFEHTKTLAFGNPALFARLQEKVLDYSVAHAAAQVAAGAQAFQLFDTWAELLDLPAWRRLCLEPANRFLRELRARVGKDIPLIYFSKGSAGQLPALPEVEADVISIDWRLPLAQARAAMPGRVLQGNLDPLYLLAGPEVTRARALELLAETKGQKHVFNLGHGILPPTPHDSVDALVETVRGFRA
ncbi:MAG: uroporphyrinogen decarboxylase [Planctomycetota bacterium]